MRDRRTIRAALLLLPAAMLCVLPLIAQELPAEPASPERPGDRPAGPLEETGKPVVARLQIAPRPPGGITLRRLTDDSGIHEVAADAGYRLEFRGPTRLDEASFHEIILVPVRVDFDPDYGAVFDRIANRLREHLKPITSQQIDGVHRQAEEAHKTFRTLQAELRKHQLDLAGRGILPKGLEEQTARLHEIRLTLQVELAGMKARREAILRHLEEQEKRLADERGRRARMDIRYLEKSLALKKNEFIRLLEAEKRVPGAVPERDIERAKLLFEEAQLQIDSLREAPQDGGPGGELRVGLTRQLMDVEIELAGAEARFEILDRLFKEITSEATRAAVDRFESLEREVRQAKQLHEATRDDFLRLTGRVTNWHPSEVMILDQSDVKDDPQPWWEQR